jgi:hypothetical protein
MDDEVDTKGHFLEELGSKILNLVQTEIQKPESKMKIDTVTNHLTGIILKSIHPYIVSIILIMILILILQAYLINKLIDLKTSLI